MMGFEIVNMAQEHIASLAKLEKDCFSTPWSEQSLNTELTNSHARFYVALSDGEVLGYIGSHNILGEVYITNVAVFSCFRRKGIGEALIEHLIKKSADENADFITLEVRKSNTSAASLYNKCGFSLVGERKNFYENPKEDAHLMTFYFNE